MNGLGQQAKMLSVKKGNRENFRGSDYISINAIFRYIRWETLELGTLHHCEMCFLGT